MTVPAHPVVFIDTSVFVQLIRVPGLCPDHEAMQQEFIRRLASGTRFVIPITTLIETGNHLAQCGGDRRAAAERFREAVTAAKDAHPPWMVRDVSWDTAFLEALLRGDSTGADLVEHLSARTLGTGDIAILVERDVFLRDTAFDSVDIWTIDAKLASYR